MRLVAFSTSFRLPPIIGTAVHWKKRERGIATVEFAIGVLVLLFMMLATAEVGRAFFTYNTLTKAVRSGARYAANVAANDVGLIDLTDPNKIEDIRNIMIYGDIDGGSNPVLPGFAPADINVTEDTATSGAANPYVRVRADYDYIPLIGAFSTFGAGGPGTFDLTFTMQSASNMRVLK